RRQAAQGRDAVIAFVEGVLESTGPNFMVVNVGGVGLQVSVPTSALASAGGPGQRVKLYTHLYVKEDVLALYGFAAPEELRLFLLLMNVSGVGPRNALRMLSAMSASDLVNAIAAENTDALTRVPGIGRKTAARLSLELKGPLEKEWAVVPGAIAAPVDSDAVAALTALGYSLAEARDALAAVEDGQALPLEEKIARALQHIGRP
ncbi:MAG: Holliday junction branch migration protein RuvA, partial [Dehalococcoidia bacterium]